MRTTHLLKQWILAFALSAAMAGAQALDFPHSPTVNNISCQNCHDMSSFYAKLLRVDNPHEPQDIDDTPFNNLCWSCHNGVVASAQQTHSSLTSDNGYGDWAMECRACHNPHNQIQTSYGGSAYLYTGTVSAITANTLTRTGAGWTVNAYAGLTVFPNLPNRRSYRIVSNTSDTLTLAGPVDLAWAAAGNTFAIVYGKLIKHEIETPNTGLRPVRFFRPTGANSFADGDATYDGVCEVCHTLTDHFRNNGAAPDQNHANVGGAAGARCTESCHPHSSGFAHGGGGGAGDCIACHGHDAGSLYDPDAALPYTAGAQASQGKGSVAAHSTHVETDADDLRGPRPALYCDSCHDTDAIPSFKSGTDSNGDGKYSLAETDVCDGCHSAGGAYDGVNDATIGAKNNWRAGVYEAGGALKAGKEKWCVGCHDKGSSVINGRQAPDVGGDGINYGFYASGHGSKGQECQDCHEQATSHNFDGQKTYRAASDNYQIGYRLALVDGQPPMNIPLDAADGYASAGCTTYVKGNYRLCLNCHEAQGPTTMGTEQNLLSDSRPAGGRGCGGNPYAGAAQTITGFRNERAEGFTFGMSTNPLPGNGHWDHLSDIHAVSWNLLWRSDDTGTPNSRVSCPTCHNPHGDSYGADTPTIRMTNTVFQLEWGSNQYGDYGVLGSTGQINTRCSVSCHFSADPSVYKYYREHTSPFLSAIALADINGADPLAAEAGYTNDRVIRVSFTAGGAAPTLMQCAEDISFTVNATGWIAYPGPTYDYTLSDSDGSRSVFCQLRNAEGSSHVKSAGIVLDRQGPSWAADALSAPNGGETWIQGTAQGITWNAGAVSDANLKAGDILSLEYSTDGGISFPDSIATGEANDGAYAWTVPLVDSATVRVRVSAYDKAGNRGSDVSNANFTIAPIAPTLDGITVADNDNADPAPAEAGYSNKLAVAVTLSTANHPTQMMLAEDAGFSVNSTGWIAFSANASYSLSGGDGAKTVYAKVRNSAGESATQSSAIVLDTAAPGMQATTLTAPNGGESWPAGSAQNVTWNSGHIADANLKASPIKVGYSADGGASYGVWSGWEGNDGSYGWTLPDTPSYGAKVKIMAYDKAGNTAEDASDAIFSVSPPAAYVVTTTADSGAGSLRQVMTDLVAAGGNSTIWFNIPPGSLTNGVAVINFATDLPTLSAANITIDGASQTAFAGDTNPNGPEVLLDGPCTTGTFECLTSTTVAFNITAAGVTIKDLQVANVGTAITTAADGTVIRGNHFGSASDTTGFSTRQNRYNIELKGTNAVVGGSNPADRNHITSAFYNGILVSGASGSQIVNNAIGLRANYAVAANHTWGTGNLAAVYLNAASNGLIQGNTFAGSSYGLYLFGNSDNNQIKGNRFGAYYNAGVWTSLSTPASGISIADGNAGGTLIGGPVVASDDANLNDSNVFDPGASGTAIYVYDATDYTTRIYGNFIGTNPERDETFGGGYGIYASYLSGLTIGGADAGEAGNVLANMSSAGVALLSSSTNYVEISRNTFYNNGANTGDDAIVLNGGNGGLARPSISAVSTSNVTVDGVSGGNGTTQLGDIVEVYLADFAGSEYGEGKTFVGAAQVALGATSVVVPVSGVSQGDSLTAIRTNVFTTNNAQRTSPFSARKRLAGPAVPTLAWTGEANYTTDGVNPNSAVSGSDFTFRVSYADADNDPPGVMELWVDINNNGSYDANEKFAMGAVDGGDTNYADGKLYTKSLPMAAVLNGVHNYRFHATDDRSDATGSPTVTQTFTAQPCSGLAVNPAGTYFEVENSLATLNQGSATFVQETAVAGYNGAGYLRSNGTSSATVPPTEQGKLYPLNFATTGNYTVWIRARGAASTQKSVFVGRDGSYTGAPSTGFTYNTWIWTKAVDAGVATINIGAAGSHVFNLWVRDTGFRVDAVYLTQGAETPSDATVPSGATVLNPAVCTP